jgi:hypothetical protein
MRLSPQFQISATFLGCYQRTFTSAILLTLLPST